MGVGRTQYKASLFRAASHVADFRVRAMSLACVMRATTQRRDLVSKDRRAFTGDERVVGVGPLRAALIGSSA
jgi:hypothetical protein